MDAVHDMVLFEKLDEFFVVVGNSHLFCAEIICMHYVYILKCADDKIYTGCTSDLKRRLVDHSQSKVSYTKTRRPVELLNYVAFKDKYKAFQFEKYLKSGSGRAFLRKRIL